jgi:hypothetical protein
MNSAQPTSLMESLKAVSYLEKIKQDPKPSPSNSAIAMAMEDTIDQQIEALSPSFKSWLSKRENSCRPSKGRCNNNKNRGNRGNYSNRNFKGLSMPYKPAGTAKSPATSKKWVIHASEPEHQNAKYINKV